MTRPVILGAVLGMVALAVAGCSTGRLPDDQLPMYGGKVSVNPGNSRDRAPDSVAREPLPHGLPSYIPSGKTKRARKVDTSEILRVLEKEYTRNRKAEKAVDVAFSHFLKRDYVTAMRQFNQAWLLDPNNGDIYHGFALVVFERDRNVAEAEVLFWIAIRLGNASSGAYSDFGRFFVLLGRYADAADIMAEGLKIDPGFVDMRRRRAVVLMMLRNYDEACAEAARAEVDYRKEGRAVAKPVRDILSSPSCRERTSR